MKYNFDDTIAAIATPPGRAGIGVVRISGVDSLRILSEIFVPGKPDGKKARNFKSHQMNYGFIKSRAGIIDEVMATYMKAPRTYTREDVAEISCHGGITAVTSVLALVLEKGARPAENGEFTRRAFMNGRIDLSQAEAVMDLINSQTDIAGRAAVTRLRGGLSLIVKKMRDEIMTLLAHIFVSIDYPEHEAETLNNSLIKEKSVEILRRIDELVSTAETGRILNEGIETAIVGRTNVGKSSLLNAFLNEDRAIVTDIPGTTRDFISEYMNMFGVPLRLVDTAGIRETEDKIEKIGVERSIRYMEAAELILFVIDGSTGLTDEDVEIFETVKAGKFIILVNKSDLPHTAEAGKIAEILDLKGREENIFFISARDHTGFEPVFQRIKDMFLSGGIRTNDEVIISNLRNKTSLQNAASSLKAAVIAGESGMTEDLVAIDLQACCDYLGEITGETLDEELIDKIFSEFCLGK